MTTENLTYKEISERLGTQIDSVRKLVRRRRWQKIKGNDGEIRVSVPVDYFKSQERTQPPAQERAQDTDREPSQSYQRELELEIEKLKALLASVEQDRDRWHSYAIRPWWKRLAG